MYSNRLIRTLCNEKLKTERKLLERYITMQVYYIKVYMLSLYIYMIFNKTVESENDIDIPGMN